MTSLQIPFNLVPAPRYSRAAFTATAANRSALAFVENWPQWPAQRLLLVGPAGSGKTHLAHIWAEKAGAQFIDARTLTVEKGVDPGRSTAFVLDDVQCAHSERALFHFLNVAAQRRCWLLMTIDQEPAQMTFKLPDLRSRLNGAPRCHLAWPDEELLEAVLIKLFEDRQMAPDPNIIGYITKRIERTLSAAETVVAAIDRVALSRRQAVNLSHAREVLEPAGG